MLIFNLVQIEIQIKITYRDARKTSLFPSCVDQHRYPNICGEHDEWSPNTKCLAIDWNKRATELLPFLYFWKYTCQWMSQPFILFSVLWGLRREFPKKVNGRKFYWLRVEKLSMRTGVPLWWAIVLKNVKINFNCHVALYPRWHHNRCAPAVMPVASNHIWIRFLC